MIMTIDRICVDCGSTLVAMLYQLVFVLLLTRSYSSAEQKHQLLFSYITTVTGGIRAIGGRPVVDLALEEINSRNDILQNYTLNYTTIRNSECTRAGALNSFFEDFPYTCEPDQTTFIALVCCGCASATIPVAEISHYWNIPQIAYASGDEDLSDRSRYRSLFVANPSIKFIGIAVAVIVRQFGWRQIAVISQDETLFTGANALLRKALDMDDFILDDSALISTNEEYLTAEELFPYDVAFSWMNRRDFRVIFVNTYVQYAYLILCEAYRRGLLPPKYVWFTPLWYNREWWKPVSEKLSFACTESEMLQVLIGSAGAIPDGFLVMENTTTTISQRSTSSFNEEYRRRLTTSQYYGLDELGVAGAAYDGIWSIALGLDRAMNRVVNNNDSGCEELVGELVPLEMFNYTNQKMGCVLEQSIAELEFTGITGSVSYDSFGRRPGDVLLLQQYREIDNEGNIERETVAEILIEDTENYFMFREGEEETTLWEMGVPYDGFPVEVIRSSNIGLVGIISTLVVVGLIFILACLVFNIIFKNRKVVKLSSPSLNYLIIVGAFLLYMCACVFVIPMENQISANVICNLRLWLFSVGYTLCFAVILSKTWRIYYIFTNPTIKKKAIKDWLLLVIIMVIFALDMLILLIGTAVPTSRLQGMRVPDEEDFKQVTDDGINEEVYIYVCSVDDSVIWLGFSFAYKALLQIVGMFMAFHTRKVKIKALNESKETATIIYINSIILVLLVVNVFAVDGYYIIRTILSSLVLLVQATVFLGILFTPKAISLYRDPNGAKIFDSGTTDNIVTDPQEKIKMLSDQVKALEARLKKEAELVDSSLTNTRKME